MTEKSYGVCRSCKVGTAVINYSEEPIFNMTFKQDVKYLCRPCFINRLKQAILDLQKNLRIHIALLEGGSYGEEE